MAQRFSDDFRKFGFSTAREFIDSSEAKAAGLTVDAFPGDLDEWSAWNHGGIVFFYRAQGAEPDEGLGWTRGYLDTQTNEWVVSGTPATRADGQMYQDVHRMADSRAGVFTQLPKRNRAA